jgi:hypothetical protein
VFNSRPISTFTLVAACILGAWLRFHALGTFEITSDESASWAAAAAPTVLEVVHSGGKLNPGKLALHDLALHFWMLAFGDSVWSMRALSAALGTLAILLVFLVALELFNNRNNRQPPENLFPREDAREIAAVSALIFSLNLTAIKFSREARMYPLLLVAGLGQVWFLIRAARAGGAWNYAGAILLGFATMAANFSAVLLFWAEGFWILSVVWRSSSALADQDKRRKLRIAVAVAATALAVAGRVLVRFVRWYATRAVWAQGWFAWFRPGTIYWLRHFLSRAVLSPIFPVTVGLGVWGTIRMWRRDPEAASLALLWMFVPVVLLAMLVRKSIALLTILAYAWTPIFVERYFVTCLVPFCIFIAFGIRELPNSARLAALALFAALALGKIRAYEPTIDDPLQWGVQWREAAAIVEPELKEGRAVNAGFAAPAAAVRYYLRDDPAVNPALIQPSGANANILILPDMIAVIYPKMAAELRSTYPHVVARLQGASVLRR